MDWGWFSENAWAGWLGAGLLLATAELVSLDLVLLMLAVGAFAGAATSALGAGAALSTIVAAVVALAMLGLARPSLIRRLHRGPELASGVKALVGAPAVVLELVDAHSGQVKIGGEVWSARSFDPTLRLDVGSRVNVYEIDGATAVVYPEDPLG